MNMKLTHEKKRMLLKALTSLEAHLLLEDNVAELKEVRNLAQEIATDYDNFTDEGIELSDGGVIEFPETDDGSIRRRDIYGNTMEVRLYGDDGYWEFFDYFNGRPEQFFEGLLVHVESGNRKFDGVVRNRGVQTRGSWCVGDRK
jgi:hypothetical protein